MPAVVVVDRSSRKSELISNAGGVVQRMRTVVKSCRARSLVLFKGRESISYIGGPRIRCLALGLLMAQNGADEMAQINPLLMKYH